MKPTILKPLIAIKAQTFKRGLQNQSESPLLVTIMSKSNSNHRVAALRERKAAQGYVPVNLYMPAALVSEIDKIKQERGETSRAPILEEAARLLLEKTRAEK